MQKRANVLRLTESAIMIAFATVLSEIQIANLPFGGSVTACSMLPILIIAYRYGTSWGIFTAVVNGLMQMLLGMGNLKYGTNAMAVIIIVLFDYIIAFGVLGLGGIFRKSIKNQGLSLALLPVSSVISAISFPAILSGTSGLGTATAHWPTPPPITRLI